MNIFKTTSTCGKGFTKTENENEYLIRIYPGGFAGVKTDSLPQIAVSLFLVRAGLPLAGGTASMGVMGVTMTV